MGQTHNFLLVSSLRGITLYSSDTNIFPANDARYLFAYQGHEYKGAVETMTKSSIADIVHEYMVSQGVDYRTPCQIRAMMTDTVNSYKQAYEIVHDLEGEGSSRA
jgi:hypothetical protein